MKGPSHLPAILVFMSSVALSRDYHVSVHGDDRDPGTASRPFRTIARAAREARPGDIVIVHGGVYREKVVPPRGGASKQRPIVYQAADGEKVEIKGSEVIKGWKRFKGTVWQVTIWQTSV